MAYCEPSLGSRCVQYPYRDRCIHIGVGFDVARSTINHTIFTVDKKACTLYVPQGTSPIYKQTDVWGDFENIVEYEVTTGIDKTSAAICATEVSRYAADGQRLDAPAKGMNIVKYGDGTVKKVVVK